VATDEPGGAGAGTLPLEPGSAVRFVAPPPPRTPKSGRTRRHLLEVSARAFVDGGYDAVSMRDIAAAAGLTKGAIYGHFRSKGQLLVEVIRWKLAAREHSERFAAVLGDPEHAVGLLYDDSGREILLLEVDAAAAARHDADVEAGLADLYEERQARIRAAVADARDPELAAWLVSALSAGIAMKQAAKLALPDPERLRAALAASLRALT
jgi:AcrR family transcriptional regulator